MGIDTTQAAHQIMAQMEAIEQDYEDKDGYALGAIVTIVSVDGPDGAEFRIRHNLDNPFLTLAVLRLAENQWIQHLGEAAE